MPRNVCCLLHRFELCGFPGEDAADKIGDALVLVLVEQAHRNRRTVSALAVDEEPAIGWDLTDARFQMTQWDIQAAAASRY